MTEPPVRLFAYDGKYRGVDAHAVQLLLNKDDVAALDATRAREKVGRWDEGLPVIVTDQGTGKTFEVKSAPCGLGCHCASVAREVTG